MLERMVMNDGMSQVDVPKLFQKTYQLIVNIAKGESLNRDDIGNALSTFISVRSQGLT